LQVEIETVHYLFVFIMQLPPALNDIIETNIIWPICAESATEYQPTHPEHGPLTQTQNH